MKHKYFISFSFLEKSGATGTGNNVVETEREFKGIEDIRATESFLIEQNKDFKKIVINNFIKL